MGQKSVPECNRPDVGPVHTWTERLFKLFIYLLLEILPREEFKMKNEEVHKREKQ